MGTPPPFANRYGGGGGSHPDLRLAKLQGKLCHGAILTSACLFLGGAGENGIGSQELGLRTINKSLAGPSAAPASAMGPGHWRLSRQLRPNGAATQRCKTRRSPADQEYVLVLGLVIVQIGVNPWLHRLSIETEVWRRLSQFGSPPRSSPISPILFKSFVSFCLAAGYNLSGQEFLHPALKGDI